MLNVDLAHETPDLGTSWHGRNFGYAHSRAATEVGSSSNIRHGSRQVEMVDNVLGVHDGSTLRNSMLLLRMPDDSEYSPLRVIYKRLLDVLGTEIGFSESKQAHGEDPRLTISQSISNQHDVADLLWKYGQSVANFDARTMGSTVNKESMIGRPSLKDVLLAPGARIEQLAAPRGWQSQRLPPEF